MLGNLFREKGFPAFFESLNKYILHLTMNNS